MINTSYAVTYLIDLFKSLKNDNGEYSYSCSNLKLGRLLTLASFLYACNTNGVKGNLLTDDIISLCCGATIRYIDFTLLHYNGGKDYNQKIEKQIGSNVPCDLDKEYENLLKYVFCNFGAYSPRTLGLYIDEYKSSNIKEWDIIEINETLLKDLRTKTPDTSKYNLEPFSKYIENYPICEPYEYLEKESLCSTSICQMSINEIVINGLKSYNYNGHKVEASYVRINCAPRINFLIKCFRKLKKRVVRNSLEMFVFLIFDLSQNTTYECRIYPDNNKSYVKAHDDILSREKDIMPKIETLFNES